MKNDFDFLAPALRKSALHNLGHEHLIIRDGRITASNGVISASIPFPVDFECNPRADLFVKAHGKAGDTIGYDLSRDVLTIRAQGLRVAVPCLPERPYQALPTGEPHGAPTGFLAALRECQPFIGTDDARPWGKAILWHNGFYTATNNVTVYQTFKENNGVPPIAFPDFLVNHAINLKETPEAVRIDESSITLHYEGERWIKSQLYEGEWPIAQVNKLLSETPLNIMQTIPEGLDKALTRIAPFCKDQDYPKVYFRDGGIGTDSEPSRGAFVEFEGLPDNLTFSLRALSIVAPVAHIIDWNHRLKRHVFYSKDDTKRGAIMGIG